jgi:hypothetical protein
MTSEKFSVGDRVMAYNHRGEKEGKGTVVPSQDKRLLDYVKIQLDDSGVAIYFADVNVKRLVKKTAPVRRVKTVVKKTSRRRQG